MDIENKESNKNENDDNSNNDGSNNDGSNYDSSNYDNSYDDNSNDDDSNENIATKSEVAEYVQDEVTVEKINETLKRTAEIFLNSTETPRNLKLDAGNEEFPCETEMLERNIENGDEDLPTKGLHQLMFEKLVKLENRSTCHRKDLLENIRKDFVSLGVKYEKSGRTLLYHLLR